MIKMRYNQNVAAVPVPICDACAEGHCTACEGGNCACQWTHQGPDWDELREEQSHESDSKGVVGKIREFNPQEKNLVEQNPELQKIQCELHELSEKMKEKDLSKMITTQNSDRERKEK